MSWLAKQLKNSKLIGVALIGLGLLCYLLGFKLLLVPTLLLTMAWLLPMPSIINSWFSRLVMALLMLWSTLAIAAALQLLINRHGGFHLIAIIVVVLTLVLIVLFGASARRVRLVSAKDIVALLAAGIFMLPFAPILLGHNSFQQIAKIGSVQIVDATVHYDDLAAETKTQNLDYYHAHYYPRGFHVGSGFMEDSLYGGPRTLSWKANAISYLVHYMFMSMLLGFVLVYLGYGLLALVNPPLVDSVSVISAAGSIGVVAALYLLVFMNEGFYNYYYICAAILAGALYVLDIAAPKMRDSLASRRAIDAWPVVGYLLITAGASYSWPIFTPAILLTPLILVANGWRSFRLGPVLRNWWNIIVGLAVSAHLLAFYFQVHYDTKHSLNAGGAIQTFNQPLVLILTVVFVIVLASNRLTTAAKNRLLAVVLPYQVVVLFLLALQYFTTGSAHYYLIKTTMLLEMMLLAVAVVYLVMLLSQMKIGGLLRLLVAPILVLFVVFGTSAMLPQPLHEIRALFRDYSSEPKPPLLDSDTYLVAKLGTEGKLIHYNLSVLHYDPATDHFYAHAQIGQWANSMGNKVTNEYGVCFSRQYNALAYGSPGPAQSQEIIAGVKDCAVHAHQAGRTYYLVTDQTSVPKLRALFGDSVQLVTD